MAKTIKKMSGLKYILTGLALMAVASAISSEMGVFKSISAVLWADLAIHVIGWIAIIFGMIQTRAFRVEFKRGLIASAAGFVCTAVQVLFVFKQFRAGLGAASFIDLYAMFFEYLSDILMLTVFYLSVKAMGQLMAKEGHTQMALSSKKIIKFGIIAVLVSMMIVPMAAIFPVVLKVAIATAAVVIGLLMEFLMIKYMNDSYRKIN